VLKKLSKSFKRMAKASFAMLLITAWMAPVSAAAASYTVTEESDWYFEVDARQHRCPYLRQLKQSCAPREHADPFLWLYDLSGTRYSHQMTTVTTTMNRQCVSSKIDTTLDAGVYRLRAGYCCSQQSETVTTVESTRLSPTDSCHKLQHLERNTIHLDPYIC
jgi:hypothetical protein